MQSRIPLLAAIVLAVAGCATGHDGDINVGGGQDPDPVVLDFPIAYIKGPLPDGTEDVRELETFQAGSDLWLRDRAACERHLSAGYCECMTGGMAQELPPNELAVATAAFSRQHVNASPEQRAHVESVRADYDRACSNVR